MLQYRVNSVLPVGCSVCVLKLTCRGWRWVKYSTTNLFLWHYLELLLREMVTLCSHRDASENFSFIKRHLKVSILVNGRRRQSLILSGNLLLPREVFCPGKSPQPELYYLKIGRNISEAKAPFSPTTCFLPSCHSALGWLYAHQFWIAVHGRVLAGYESDLNTQWSL